MARGHTHVCRTCGEDFACNAYQELNYDGWPEVVCDLQKRPEWTSECPVCEALPRCDWCGDSIDVEPFTEGGLTYCSRLCYEDCERELQQATERKSWGMPLSRLWVQLGLTGGLALGLGEWLKVPPLSWYGLLVGGVGVAGMGFGWARRWL